MSHCQLQKGKIRLSSVGRKAVPQPWSTNWKCPIAETSVGTWNKKTLKDKKYMDVYLRHCA